MLKGGMVVFLTLIAHLFVVDRILRVYKLGEFAFCEGTAGVIESLYAFSHDWDGGREEEHSYILVKWKVEQNRNCLGTQELCSITYITWRRSIDCYRQAVSQYQVPPVWKNVSNSHRDNDPNLPLREVPLRVYCMANE